MSAMVRTRFHELTISTVSLPERRDDQVGALAIPSVVVDAFVYAGQRDRVRNERAGGSPR